MKQMKANHPEGKCYWLLFIKFTLSTLHIWKVMRQTYFSHFLDSFSMDEKSDDKFM